MIIKKILFLLICLCFVHFSCAVTDSENEEDRGTLLTSAINTSWLNLIWSKTSNELITGGTDGVRVVDINTKKDLHLCWPYVAILQHALFMRGPPTECKPSAFFGVVL